MPSSFRSASHILPLTIAHVAGYSTLGQGPPDLSVFVHGVTNALPYPPAMVIELKGTGSQNCLMECSSDLASWEPLALFYARYATLSRFPTNNLVWDPLIEPSPIRFYRARLPGQWEPEPHQIWTAKKPARYRFHYKASGALLLSAVTNLAGDVHVKGGVVWSIENITGAEGIPPQMLTNSFRTIDGLFELVRTGYGHNRSQSVSFDREWGYPKWILMDATKEFDTEPSPATTHSLTDFAAE